MRAWRRGTEDAYKELAFAVIKQAVQDYKQSARLLARLLTGLQIYDKADPETLEKAKRESAKMRELREWLFGDYCAFLLQGVVSPERVLAQLDDYEYNYRKERTEKWLENQSRRFRSTRPSAAERAKGQHMPRRKVIKRLQYRRQSAGARLPKNIKPRRVN